MLWDKVTLALVKEGAGGGDILGTTHGRVEEGILKATKMGVDVTLPFKSLLKAINSLSGKLQLDVVA